MQFPSCPTRSWFFRLALMALLWTGTAWAVPEKQLPLRVDYERALQLARQHNPEWKALAALPKAASGDLVQAGMSPNPVLTLRGGANFNWRIENAGLGMSQEIELGGKREARLALASARLEVAEWQAKDGERLLRQQLRQEFSETLYWQHLSDIRQELLELSQESLALTRKRLKLGDVAGLDVVQLETEVARRLAATQESAGQLRARKAALTRLLGEPASIELVLDGQLGQSKSPLPPLEELQKAALYRPDFMAVQAETEARHRDTQLQRARGVSNLTASLGLSRERLFVDSSAFYPRGVLDRIDDQDWMVTASLSIALPINDSNEGNIQRAAAQAEGAVLQQEVRQQIVQSEVARAYHEWSAAQEVALTLEDSAIQRARQTLDATNKAYQLGFRSLLNVLQARQEYLDLQLLRLDALRTQEMALARLEAAIGGNLP